MCSKFTDRPFGDYFFDTENVWGGVIIGLGTFIGLCGRRFQKLTNFLISSMVTAFVIFLVFSAVDLGSSLNSSFVFTCIVSCLAALIVGALSSYFIRFGGALIGAIAGFLLGMLIDNASTCVHNSVLMAYLMCGFLAFIFFVFALMEHKFNTTVIFGNSFIAAYMIIRGIAVYVGYWHYEIILNGEISCKNEIAAVNPRYYAYCASVFVLWLILVPI